MLDVAPVVSGGPSSYDVEYTARNLANIERDITEMEERKRPLRERRGPDVVLDRALEHRDKLRGDMEGHRTRQRAGKEGFEARKRYLADHEGDRQKIERIDELLVPRAQSAVADAKIETPKYLKELIGDYRSGKHKGRWIDAATKVEDYRHRQGFTDIASAFGVGHRESSGTLGSTLTMSSPTPANHDKPAGDYACAEPLAPEKRRPGPSRGREVHVQRCRSVRRLGG